MGYGWVLAWEQWGRHWRRLLSCPILRTWFRACSRWGRHWSWSAKISGRSSWLYPFQSEHSYKWIQVATQLSGHLRSLQNRTAEKPNHSYFRTVFGWAYPLLFFVDGQFGIGVGELRLGVDALLQLVEGFIVFDWVRVVLLQHRELAQFVVVLC